MAEVEAVSARFAPFALACSRIYFSLQQLPDLHFLYQTSLTFFLEVVDRVLAAGASAGLSMSIVRSVVVGRWFVCRLSAADDDADLEGLILALVQSVFQRVSCGLIYDHRIVLALRLVQIFMASKGWELTSDEMELLLRGSAGSHVEVDSKQLAFVQSTFTGDASLSSSQQRVTCCGCACEMAVLF